MNKDQRIEEIFDNQNDTPIEVKADVVGVPGIPILEDVMKALNPDWYFETMGEDVSEPKFEGQTIVSSGWYCQIACRHPGKFDSAMYAGPDLLSAVWSAVLASHHSSMSVKKPL